MPRPLHWRSALVCFAVLLVQAVAAADEPGVELQLELAEAEAEDAALAIRYGPRWPRRVELRAVIDHLRDSLVNDEPLTALGRCQLRDRLDARLVRLRAQLTALLERYRSDWPGVVALRAQIEVLEQHRNEAACALEPAATASPDQ